MAKRVESKKGLIAYETRPDPAGIETMETKPGTVRMLAPDPTEIVKGIVAAYQEDAREIISDAGRDPNDWPIILREKTVADPIYCAARMLRDLHKLNRAMVTLAKHFDDKHVSQVATHETVRAALAVGLTARSLELVLHEDAVMVGQKVSHKLPDSNPGGRPRGSQLSRNVQMARDFLMRTQRSGKSDSALMEEIGRAHHLGRSQSIAAIKDGLKKLSGKPA